MELDPKDPFESLLIPMIETNRKKRADYTHGGDIYSNFREAAHATGHTDIEIANVMIAIKSGRIKALSINKTAPQNESLVDSYLDRAVYSILAYGLCKEQDKASGVHITIDDTYTYGAAEARLRAEEALLELRK